MLKFEILEERIIISLGYDLGWNYFEDPYFNKLIKIVIQIMSICNIDNSVEITKNGF